MGRCLGSSVFPHRGTSAMRGHRSPRCWRAGGSRCCRSTSGVAGPALVADRTRQMGPAMRRRVALDVEAAVEYLAAVDGVDPMRLGLLLEQDTAADALDALASLEAARRGSTTSPPSPCCRPGTRRAPGRRSPRSGPLCTAWSRARIARGCGRRSTPTSRHRPRTAGSTCSVGWVSASRSRRCCSSRIGRRGRSTLGSPTGSPTRWERADTLAGCSAEQVIKYTELRGLDHR